MGLTPDEVRDVTFDRAPWGQRGYHEHEVDAFLDHVYEQLLQLRAQHRLELSRLVQENDELRDRVAELTGEPLPRRRQPSVEPATRQHYAASSERPTPAKHR
ncbi:DivIVA domain-containing protein [Rhodococcus sp. X156]|uniref:DivIVA domain-containing protein n=1 Tax=Rhodococcus sp. X156 TaxID=2499145 RepID=UPI000FD8AC1D|nr:DivIVA domain-containing protein [Rhodococcus sp. X156]